MSINAEELKALLKEHLQLGIKVEQKSFGCDGGASFVTVQIRFDDEVLTESWLEISGAEVSG